MYKMAQSKPASGIMEEGVGEEEEKGELSEKGGAQSLPTPGKEEGVLKGEEKVVLRDVLLTLRGGSFSDLSTTFSS